MKNLFGIIFMAFLFSCNGKNNQIKGNVDTITGMEIVLDSNKTFLEKYLTIYVDSVDNATVESRLPKFLENSQFDYSNRGAWTTIHMPISVRSQIINRINNCKPLLLIMRSKNEKFKEKPHIEDNLVPPNIELSFYELVIKRIDVLECKKI